MKEVITTTLKAIWLAVKEGDFISAIKLLNIQKNEQFFAMLDELKEHKKL